jgi:hypothetical protein
MLLKQPVLQFPVNCEPFMAGYATEPVTWAGHVDWDSFL